MPYENIDVFAARPKQTSVLNFGPPKTGKTRSEVTLLDMGLKPLWMFDFDNGADSLVGAAIAKGYKGEDIRVYRYNPMGGDKIGDTQGRPRAQGRDTFLQFLKDFNQMYDMTETTAQGLRWKKGANAPAVISIDSTTELQEVILDFVLCMVGHELGAPGTDARSDFGKAMQKTVEIINSAKGLPCVSVFNAHESLDKNEITGEVRIDPYFTGKLAASIAEKFSVVLYSTTRNIIKSGVPPDVEYIWYTKPKGFIKSAGTRHHEGLSQEIPQDYKLVL